MKTLRRWTPALLALFVVACEGGPGEPEPPVVLSHTTEAAHPLAHRLTLSLEEAAPVTVEYSAAEGPVLSVSADASEAPALTLARLRAGVTYEYRVLRTDTRGTFTAGPAPDAVDGITVDAEGASTAPLALMQTFGSDQTPLHVIIDSWGEVVWYYVARGGASGVTRRTGGNFVISERGHSITEVTPTGEVVASLPHDVARPPHHDVVATPQGTVLFIAHDARTVAGTEVLGEAIWEWDPDTDALSKRWSSWGHFDVHDDVGWRFNEEWMHANSLHIGPRGNVLMSVRYWNQVFSIAPDFGSVEWRMGGPNATIPVEGEPFSAQHTASEIAPNRVLVYDNDVDDADRTRVVEYDIASGRAVPVWEWTPEPRIYAFAVGSARRLPNGNTMVGFGMPDLRGSTGPVSIYEVDPSGTVVWRAEPEGVFAMYRAEPIRTIAGEVCVRRCAPGSE